MSDEIAGAIFQKAVDASEAAGSRHFVAVLALIAFHVLLFAPYVGAEVGAAQSRAEMAQDQALGKESDQVAAALSGFEKASVGTAETRLAEARAQLADAFRRLDEILPRFAGIAPDAAAGPAGEALFAVRSNEMAAQQPMAQMQAPPTSGGMNASWIPAPMPPEMRRQVAVAIGNYDRPAMLSVIRPYVESTIITPILGRFNTGWRGEALPAIDAAKAQAETALSEAIAAFPERTGVWEAVRKSLAEATKQAAALELRAPSDPLWWSQSATKDFLIHETEQRLAQNLSDIPALASLRTTLQGTLSAEQARYDALQAELSDLDQKFKEQEAELAEILSPLKAVAVDLGRIVPWFPLILGLALGGSWMVAAQRRDALAAALQLLSEGEQRGKLAIWLAKASPHRRSAILGRTLLYLAWLALAAKEAAGLPNASSAETLIGAAIGAAAIAIAGVRNLQSERVMTLTAV